MEWRYQGNDREGWLAAVSDTRQLWVFFSQDSEDDPGSWAYGVGSIQSGELLTWIYPAGDAPDLATAKRLAVELWEASSEHES